MHFPTVFVEWEFHSQGRCTIATTNMHLDIECPCISSSGCVLLCESFNSHLGVQWVYFWVWGCEMQDFVAFWYVQLISYYMLSLVFIFFSPICCRKWLWHVIYCADIFLWTKCWWGAEHQCYHTEWLKCGKWWGFHCFHQLNGLWSYVWHIHCLGYHHWRQQW